MIALDEEGLATVRAWAEGRIEAEDRRRRTAPLMAAMLSTIAATHTGMVPEMMAGPEAAVRRSVLNMERSQAELPARLAEREREIEAHLVPLRARTAELRLWLEALA